jgi:hypothetical protein
MKQLRSSDRTGGGDPGGRVTSEAAGFLVLLEPIGRQNYKEVMEEGMRTHWLIGTLVVAFVLGAAALAIAAESAGPPAVEVHGWSLTRYYVDTTVFATRESSGEVTNEEEESHLEWERFSLSALARLPEGRQAYAEVYIHPWLPNDDPSFLYLESLYLDVPTADPSTKVRLGKGRSYAFGITPAYGARKTSNYGPLAEAFTMDRALGLQVMHTKGPSSLNVGIFNSQRPGARLIGLAADQQLEGGAVGVTTVAHLTNRDAPQDRSGQLELSARYGRDLGDVDVGLSGRGGALDDTDAAFLASKFPTYNGTNKTRLEYGFDAKYNRMPWYATAEYYGGTLGGIRQSGYAVLLGVEPTKDCTGIWREFSSACKGLFVRYTSIDIGVPTTASPYSWDTQQWAASYVLPLTRFNVPYFKWLQFEYENNSEDVPPGFDEVPNNVFFVELFGAF